MILVIDNYDSFVHNLARYVRELGEDAIVERADALTVGDVEAMSPSRIIISPGPCTPNEAGISVELIRRLGPSTPILGVCLGHQCIGAAYDGDVIRAGHPVHGRTSPITHDRSGVLVDVPSPFQAARYHSLVIAASSLPSCLRVTATSADDGEIMAVEHRQHPVVGVQFHPESAATEYGYWILDRFLHGDIKRRVRATGADGVDHAPPVDAPPLFVPPAVELVR